MIKRKLIEQIIKENSFVDDYNNGSKSYELGENDIKKISKLIVKKLTTPDDVCSFSYDLQSCINAEKENRIKRIETFVPAFEDDTICHFFWVIGSKYPLL